MKKDLILLHGALGAGAQLEKLEDSLSTDYLVHKLDFEGHGARATSADFSIALFAKNLEDYIRENKLNRPDVLGYSMGGYVAIYLSAHQPELVGKIMTLGTKFHWSPSVAAREVKMLNPDVIEVKVPQFAAHLNRMHTAIDWKENMRKTAQMMLAMGEQPPLTDQLIEQVLNPVLLTRGDLDKMVSLEETTYVQNRLQNASFKAFETFDHPMEKVDVNLLSVTAKQFFES